MFNEYEYNTEIDVYSVETEGEDDYGFPILNTILYIEGIYAKEKSIKYEDKSSMMGTYIKNEVVFVIDYREDISNWNEIKRDDEMFRIIHQRVWGKPYDKKLEITCIKKG